MPLPSWMTQVGSDLLLRLYVQPKASRSEVVGEHGEGDSVRLKIRVAAPPVDGAANEELLRFLKKTLDIAASRIDLVRGESSRAKDVLIRRCTQVEVAAKLNP